MTAFNGLAGTKHLPSNLNNGTRRKFFRAAAAVHEQALLTLSVASVEGFRWWDAE